MIPHASLGDEQDLESSVARILRSMVGASDRSPEEIRDDEEAGWPEGLDTYLLKGVRDIRVEKGRLRCTVPITGQQMLNPYGTLHGGCIATMIDGLTTAVLWTASGLPGGISVELNVSCMATAKAGEDVEIEALVSRSGRSLAVATAKICRKRNGALLAEGRHTKYIALNESKL